jgi:peptide/nickel transport system ATP-binding protein
MTVMLSLQNVSLDYVRNGKKFRALSNVSLACSRGERWAVVGESGSGKSSLLKLMLGLERPTEGQVLFENTPPHELKKEQRRNLQAVFQDVTAALDPRWTIRESLREPLSTHQLDSDDTALAAILARVQLPSHILGSRPALLSLGQRQRVNIARALSLSPKVLLLDEPVSALDVSVQAQVLNVISGLPSTTTMVMVTHDLTVAAHFASQIAVMKNGQVVEQNSTDSILSNPEHEYTKELLARS